MPMEPVDRLKKFYSSAQAYNMANSRDKRIPKISDTNKAKDFRKYKMYT